MVLQLPLSLTLRDDASFGNFFVAPDNEVVTRQLKKCIVAQSNEGSIYLWGQHGSGRTHLLQAACLQANSDELSAAYIPLKDFADLSVSMLEGLENYHVICLDDVDAIAGNEIWEQAVFALYNRIFEAGRQLIVSASHNVKDSPIRLPDLRSRLSWGLVFHLQELSDEEKIKALQARAHLRGFTLPKPVANYLLTHYPRDLNALFVLLHEVDHASLTAQRQLTIPIVKEWLESNPISLTEV